MELGTSNDSFRNDTAAEGESDDESDKDEEDNKDEAEDDDEDEDEGACPGKTEEGKRVGANPSVNPPTRDFLFPMLSPDMRPTNRSSSLLLELLVFDVLMLKVLLSDTASVDLPLLQLLALGGDEQDNTSVLVVMLVRMLLLASGSTRLKALGMRRDEERVSAVVGENQ